MSDSIMRKLYGLFFLWSIFVLILYVIYSPVALYRWGLTTAFMVYFGWRYYDAQKTRQAQAAGAQVLRQEENPRTPG